MGMIARRDLLIGSIALGTHAIVSAAERPRHKYSNPEAMKYAQKHCGTNENACGRYLSGENLSDCAHFIAHCLHAGGITIKNPDPGNALCPTGLAVRNVDIESHLKKLAAQYANIKEITLADAIVGDYGFLKTIYPTRGGYVPTHAFMIAQPGKYMGPLSVPYVWAHSMNRCKTQMETDWAQAFSS